MLTKLPYGWYRFGNGKLWRIRAPYYFCEVDNEGNIPDFSKLASTVAKLKQIKSYYKGKINAGILDEYGTALDILVANSMTESLGTVPSPLEYDDLKKVYEQSKGTDAGAKLDEVVRYIANIKGAKYLERREPGYKNPLSTPSKISLGSHHILLSTAFEVRGWKNDKQKLAHIEELVLSLPSKTIYAAQFAIDYLNARNKKHLNQPPLLAATYNAGSPRLTSDNPWNLVQYGEHIDRWVSYYNTSRKIN
jgi:hypothetical protein